MDNVIPIPPVPQQVPEDQKTFFVAVKELLETFNGLRDPNTGILGLSTEDVENAIRRSPQPYTDVGSIKPPTSLVITTRTWSHLLEWVNTKEDHLDGVEVWCHTLNSVTEATRIAICGRGNASYERFGMDVTQDWYYWIRSVSYAGKYSEWCPSVIQGGLLVPRKESLVERIEGILNALKGEDPPKYQAATTYAVDDPVYYIGTDGNKRRYRRRNYDIGASGKNPTLTLYWERTGILMEGEVDGQNVVGIDGNLVVDKSILARSIETDSLTVGDGSNGTIKIVDGTITIQSLNNSLLTQVLNTNVKWENIGGTNKPQDGATQNKVFVQSTTPTNPGAGALWIDTTSSPYKHKIYHNGQWKMAATDNTNWEHPTNQTKIDGGNIYTGTIVANAIAANTITANKLNITSLSSITANIGTVTAGIAKSSDNRLRIDFNNKWIRVYDTANNLRVQLGYIP